MSGDPTMAGVRNPGRQIAKREERILHLCRERDRMNDQIGVMLHEIRALRVQP